MILGKLVKKKLANLPVAKVAAASPLGAMAKPLVAKVKPAVASMGKPMVSRRKSATPEAPVAAPMGVRKPNKPAGNPMNPMMGKNNSKRGMY